MTSPADDLALAVDTLHHAVDGWAAAVRSAGAAHPGDLSGALEHPPLAVAEDAWDEAYGDFQRAAGAVLGTAVVDAEDLADDEDTDRVEVRLTAEVSGDGDVVAVVDSAGEQVVAALEEAGFVVHEWGVEAEPLTGDDLTGDDLTGDDLTGDDLTGDDLPGADTSSDDLPGAGPSGR